MEVLKEKVNEHERRISLMEQKVDKLFDKFTDILNQMTEITTNMKYIQGDLNKMVNNFKEALTRNSDVQRTEHKTLNDRIDRLEKNVESLSSKLESDTEELDKKVDARTVEKSSNSWDKLVWLIIGAVVAYVAGVILK